MRGVRLHCIVWTLASLVLCGSVKCASPTKSASGPQIQQSGSSLPTEKFNILGVFGHQGESHFHVFAPLLEELARRGHDVTVVSFFPRDNKTSPLPTYHDISLVKEASDVFLDVVDLHTIHHSITRPLQELLVLRAWSLRICEYGLHNSKVQDFIKSDKKFHLIITEVFNSDCFLGFVHRFKAPFISLSSHQLMPWANQRLINDDNPSYVNSIFLGHEPEMTFFERLANTIAQPLFNIIYEIGTNRPSQVVVEEVFGPGVPPLRDIARNTSAVLVNTHFSLHGSKPDLPNIIQVGGIHIRPDTKPLPNDIQRFLDGAHEGVLYFSLGSMIKGSSMPAAQLDMIMNVIRNIPRKVVWKWEAEDMPDKPANLLVKKWLPQAAILKHPNVKCFMAHGGLLGMSESVQAGVPMVVIPMYGDQFHNAAAARSRGVAEVLEWEHFSEDGLRTAVDRVFNDSSYIVNARALAKAYVDRPETPLQTAVWWTEYIARGNGNAYLKSAAHNLTWYQYYLLDVVLFLGIVILVAAYVSYKIAMLCLAACNCRRKPIGVNGTNGTIHSRNKTLKSE